MLESAKEKKVKVKRGRKAAPLDREMLKKEIDGIKKHHEKEMNKMKKHHADLIKKMVKKEALK